MLVLLGCFVVIGSVLTGFSMAGGHVHLLLHPSEVVTIGGAALGGLIILAPMRVLKDLCKALVHTLKGNPFPKPIYMDAFLMFYMICRVVRRDGMLALDGHLNAPESSEIFKQFPRITGNHHLMNFITSNLAMLLEGREVSFLQSQMDAEIRVIESEHHDAVAALNRVADGLPGFGIVAAVLGIVVTMQAINGPAEEIGHKVGAALVGTFLGILASYGFFAPLAARMETLGHEEIAFFRTIGTLNAGIAQGQSPKDIITCTSSGIGTEFRPTREEVEQLCQAGNKF